MARLAPRLLTPALLLFSLGLFALRFYHLEGAVFINDEPQLLLAARAQLGRGHWLAASPFLGTQGLPYGPYPVWFYGLVTAFFGPAPLVAIAALCTVVSACELVLAAALARLVGGGLLLFAALAALLGSSPYLFFWSRMAWDNQLVTALAALAVALFCVRGPLSPWRAAALGAVLGMCLGTHLLTVPFALLAALVACAPHWREPRALLLRALPLGLAAAGVLAPYLLFLLRTPLHAGQPGPRDVAFLDRLLQPARVLSPLGIGYFFDAEWGEFLAWTGRAQLIERGSAALAVAWGALAVAGLLAGLRSVEPALRRLAWFGALLVLVYPLFFHLRGLPLEPHYQIAAFWLVPAGCALLVGWARERHPRAAALLLTLIFSLAALQAAFVAGWMRWVTERTGTRGVHYATPVGAQRAAIVLACAAPETLIALANGTVLFPFSLRALFDAEPACAAKKLILCGRACPVLPEGARLFQLVYAAPTGGSLALR